MRSGSVLPLLLLLVPACDYNNGLVDESYSTRVGFHSFTPTTGPATGGIPITLVGQNLTSDLTVYFGEQRATTVRLTSSSSLEATLPPGTLGPVPVRMVLPGGSDLTAPEPFRYRAENIRFRFAHDLGDSGYGSAYVVGDADGDGRKDIVVAAQDGMVGRLTLYCGGPDGRFAPRATFQIPLVLDFVSNPCDLGQLRVPRYSLAMADLNGDGLDDVALSSYTEQRLHLFWGDRKDGLFAYAPMTAPYLLDRCRHRYLVPVDLDGDKKKDLVVINHDEDGGVVPARPEALGTVGFLRWFAEDGGASGTLRQGPACTRLHSYLAGDREVIILCDTATHGGGKDVRLARLVLAQDKKSLVVDEDRVVLSSVGVQQRLHLFDPAGKLDVLSVKHAGGNGVWINQGSLDVEPGVVEQAGIQLSGNNQTFSLAQTGWPHLGFGVVPGAFEHTVAAPGRRPILVWPERRGITVIDHPSGQQVSGLWELFPYRPMLGPDWVNTDAKGWPLMSGAVFGDVDGDGLDDVITADSWGQTLLGFTRPGNFSSVPAWRRLPRPGVSGGEMQVWPAANASVVNANQTDGTLVDLNGDGHEDIVSISTRAGSKQTHVIDVIVVDGDGGSMANQRLEWESADMLLSARPAPVIEDVNGDGWGDFFLPAEDLNGSFALHRVVSAGGKYEYAGAASLPFRPSAFAVDAGHKGGAWRLVAAEPRCDGSCQKEERVYDLRVFSGEGLAEEQALAKNLRAPQEIVYLLDLDGDGNRDLVTAYNRVCRGANAYVACRVVDGFNPLCVSEEQRLAEADAGRRVTCGPVFSNGFFTSSRSGGYDVILFDEARQTARWVTHSNGEASSLEVSLARPEGRYLQPRVQALCDIDGDGTREAIFAARIEGRDGPVIGALARRRDQRDLQLRFLGAPPFRTESVDCARSNVSDQAALDDLVLRSSDRTYFRVINDSF